MPGIKCLSQLCSACTKVLHDQNYCKSKGSPAARHSTNWTFCTRHIRIVYFRNKRQRSNQQRNIFPYWFRVSLQFSSWLSIRDYSILKYRTPSIRAPSSIGKPSFSKNSVKIRPLEENAPIFLPNPWKRLRFFAEREPSNLSEIFLWQVAGVTFLVIIYLKNAC